MAIIEFQDFHERVCTLCAQLTTLSFQKEGKTRNVSSDEIYHHPTEMMLDLSLHFSCQLNEKHGDTYRIFYGNLKKLATGDMNIDDIPGGRFGLFHDGLMLPLSTARELWTPYFGFPLYHKGWLDALAEGLKGKKCLEIMAGSGILSRFLKEREIDIVASDSYDWNFPERFTEVIEKEATDAIREYKGDLDYVIVSWPPYLGRDIVVALVAMRKCHPNAKMIFIGEDYGGNCACDDFFELAIPTQSEQFGEDAKPYLEFEESVNRVYTNFPGMNDLMMIFK